MVEGQGPTLSQRAGFQNCRCAQVQRSLQVRTGSAWMLRDPSRNGRRTRSTVGIAECALVANALPDVRSSTGLPAGCTGSAAPPQLPEQQLNWPVRRHGLHAFLYTQAVGALSLFSDNGDYWCRSSEATTHRDATAKLSGRNAAKCPADRPATSTPRYGHATRASALVNGSPFDQTRLDLNASTRRSVCRGCHRRFGPPEPFAIDSLLRRRRRAQPGSPGGRPTLRRARQLKRHNDNPGTRGYIGIGPLAVLEE